MREQTDEMTVRVRFLDGQERIVPAKDFHWHEEGAKSATALVDGREVPIYRRAEPEWGNAWVEQMTYEQWKAEQKDISTDWQKRSKELEQLARDLLTWIKDKAPYSYEKAPSLHPLLDRAAELGIVLEVKP